MPVMVCVLICSLQRRIQSFQLFFAKRDIVTQLARAPLHVVRAVAFQAVIDASQFMSEGGEFLFELLFD
jgi:hypothetical protein